MDGQASGKQTEASEHEGIWGDQYMNNNKKFPFASHLPDAPPRPGEPLDVAHPIGQHMLHMRLAQEVQLALDLKPSRDGTYT